MRRQDENVCGDHLFQNRGHVVALRALPFVSFADTAASAEAYFLVLDIDFLYGFDFNPFERSVGNLLDMLRPAVEPSLFPSFDLEAELGGNLQDLALCLVNSIDVRVKASKCPGAIFSCQCLS